MSVATLAHDGLQALDQRNFPLAITKLTHALQTSTAPHPNPAWLIARSKAFNTTSNFPAALADADLALHSAFGRGDRKAIIDAHHRRAVAYNRLGRVADADACCVYALCILEGLKTQPKEDPADAYTDKDGFWTVDLERLQKDIDAHPLKEGAAQKKENAMKDTSPEVKLFTLITQLRTMVVRKLVSLDEKDEARKRTVVMIPPREKLYVPDGEKKEATKEKDSMPAAKSPEPQSAQATVAAVPVSENAELNIQSYESDTIMNATIFSKGVDKENLKVHFTESTVALSAMKYPGGVEKECVISLNGAIKPSECSYRVTPSKVELKLVKAEAGKWKTVGQQGVAPPTSKEEAALTPAVAEPTPAPAPKAAEPPKRSPAYPTSSRSGPVDWDKVVDLEDKDDDEGKDVNDFFKKLYADANPEMRRAMMKSFTESNGTSLSTNWDEVGKGKVETVPPEGVEAKKW